MKQKIILWLADILYGALKMFGGRIHDWLFDPDRHARIRFKHRERWWRYRQKALATKDPRDDMRAKAWQIEYGFETPPDAALARGDLGKDLATKIMEENRARATGFHQP